MTSACRSDAAAADQARHAHCGCPGGMGVWSKEGRRRLPVSNILMRTIAEFTKTTLIGGILIILPIYVSLLLLAKAVQGLLAAMKPITAVIPATRSFPKSWRS